MSEMKPGRELDALIAEKVFKLKPCSDPLGRCEGAHTNPIQCWGDGGAGEELRPYSTYITAAWEVVEHIWKEGYPNPFTEVFKTAHEMTSEDLAHKICLAALKAVENV